MQVLRKVHVVYPILTDVVEPALRLRVARGHQRDQNDGSSTDRGHVEFTLAPNKTSPGVGKSVFIYWKMFKSSPCACVWECGIWIMINYLSYHP